MEEQHYSSEDEEVFFGSLAESEVARRRNFLGDNYNSPVTPRPPRFNHVSNGMSGILGASSTSTPVQIQTSVVSCRNNQSTHVAPGGSPIKESDDDDDDDVIILDYTKNSDSVIILSDDDEQSFIESETGEVSQVHHESILSDKDFSTDPEFNSPSKSSINNSENGSLQSNNFSLRNVEMNSLDITANRSNDAVCSVEKGRSPLVQDIFHVDVENENVVKEQGSFSEASNKDVTAEFNKICSRSFQSDKICPNESVIAEGKSPQTSVNNNFDNLLSHNSLLNDVEANNLEVITNESFECNMEKNSSSIVQDINDFVGDLGILEKYSAPLNHLTVDNVFYNLNEPQNLNLSAGPSSSEGKVPKTSSCINSDSTSSAQSSEYQKNTNMIIEINDSSVKNHNNSSFSLSNLEFSLNGITDSILNISHGSSLPSPPETRLPSSPVFQTLNTYEDISFDNAQLEKSTDVSNIAKHNNKENEDLHMSVDEVDFQQEEFSDDFGTLCTFGTSIDTSEPSEYKSCPSSHSSSYNTANNRTCGNHSSSEQSDAFRIYRDVSSDLNMCKETYVVSMKSGEENLSECSFEMPVQVCPNSGTPVFEMCKTNKGEAKSTSKLPVYQNSKSLLRPPKLHIKPDTLKTTSYKFAKQISKLESEKCTSNIPRPGMLKFTGPKPLNTNKGTEKKTPLVKGKTFTKTPAKTTSSILSPKTKTPVSTSSLTKLKTPSLSYLHVLKTPDQNIVSKTLGQNIVSKTPGQNIVSKTPVQNIVSKTPGQNIVSKTPGQNIVSKTLGQNIVSKTPGQNIVNKTLGQNIASKTPVQNIVSKTPVNHAVKKTPAQNKSGIPKAVKSDSKVMRVLSPLNRCYSTETIGGSIKKEKYKNIISPIHAYIRGSPPVTLRKSKIEDEHEVNDSTGKKIFQSVTPMKSQKVTPIKSVPKAVQMLKYEDAQGQENVNPNVLNLTRDTIPSKMFEPALQLFWKEREEPRLPKMGEKLTKILSGPPKVKLIAHEGRVNQSPSSGGILIPNKENSPSSFIAPSASPHTNDADDVREARISVRIQKTMELP